MNVHFMSRAEAEGSAGHEKTAVISISDPESGPAKLSSSFSHVLRLEFHDVDSVKLGESYTLFTPNLANSIWEFTENLPDPVDTLVVHCHLGISRSAAVAKSISEVFNLAYPEGYSLYNKHIYRAMRSAYFKRTFPGQDMGLAI